jgi:hypothetical protein
MYTYLGEFDHTHLSSIPKLFQNGDLRVGNVVVGPGIVRGVVRGVGPRVGGVGVVGGPGVGGPGVSGPGVGGPKISGVGPGVGGPEYRVVAIYNLKCILE